MNNFWRHNDMILHKNRLKSLENWPISFIEKDKMAGSGFYFTGYQCHDAVECFVCNLSVGRWEMGDDPDNEHKRLSSKCTFYERRNIEFDYTPMNPEFSSIHRRFLTFREWPASLKQKPIELLNAGFYYKNAGDKVTCYYCNITLNNWTPDDDPWKEHVYFSPHCDFAKIIKGQEYIDNTVKNHRPKIMSRPNTSQHIELVVEEDKADPCSICLSAIKNICFIPCGHLAACARCALSARSCPICRHHYNATVKISKMD